ncbi:uncharacterized protein LOC129716680 [Wyeomyia smithii]|uniref:uncharacterized protein LOC129716680 n=1 Tax=Wyeomyia smithii TaxID=174621 RepID=UPI00246800C2|nr:uncharacterized protein LOC129716680 [Wyeomyia smithii]
MFRLSLVTIAFLYLNGRHWNALASKKLDWLRNTTVQAHLVAIFNRIDSIDIVIGSREPDQIDQIDYLIRSGGANTSGILQRKRFRIYEQALNAGKGCDRSLLSTKLVNSTDAINTMERVFEDEFKFFKWDHSYETFAKIWDQNQDQGYIVFANITIFDTLMKCLLDPAATYFVVLGSDEELTRDRTWKLFRSIWRSLGVFRVFLLDGIHIHTYDPFSRNGSSFGLLVELAEVGGTPTVPQGDFKGYPLRIDMFWSTYSVPVPNTTIFFTGADVMVGDAFVKALNFTAVRLLPDKDNFGSLLPNGTFNGVIGRLMRHDSDITFVGFFIKDYFSRDIEFTAGVYTDELCCLVKKASRVPEYLLPITIFPTDLWGLLFLMGMICTVVWIVLRTGIRMRARTRQERYHLATLFNLSDTTRDAPLYRKLCQIGVDTYILLVSAPYRRFTKSGTERLFLFGILLVSLIFVSMFQSGLSSIFVNPVYYKDISSLQQLDAADIRIPVKYAGFMDDVFPANYSAIMESLRSKLIFRPTNQSLLSIVSKTDRLATVTRRATLNLDNAIYISTKQLFMIPECPRLYNLAYVAGRHSVLLEQINAVLLSMLNGGLINHWIGEMNYNVTLHHWERIRDSQNSDFKVLTVVDMQFPFYLLVIGIIVSAVMFVAELIYFKFTSRK